MPKGINKIRFELVKNSIKQGNSYKQALLDGKYSKATAGHHVSDMTVLKRARDAVIEEFRASELKPEDVINRIEYLESLAVAKKDIGTAVRCEELKGNFLKMFSQNNNSKSPSQTVIIDTTGRFSHLNNVADEKRDSINVSPDEKTPSS